MKVLLKKGDFVRQSWSKLLLGLLGLGVLSTCDLINPEEPIPAYLWIAPFEVQTNPASQGTNAAKITEVWLSVDGTFAGVFPLPAQVPILKSGKVRVKVEAGIKENGISSTPEIYPFYQALEYDVELQPMQTDTLRPRTFYRSGIRFALLENFENNSHVFQTLVTGSASNRMSITAENPFEGKGAGLIQLTSQQASVELASSGAYSGLLARGASVYLELNYKAEVPLTVGVIGYRSGGLGGAGLIQYAAGFNPSAEWNKIYFNLTKVIADSKLDDYQIILKTEIPKNADGTYIRSNAKIWLDNLKLIHF